MRVRSSRELTAQLSRSPSVDEVLRLGHRHTSRFNLTHVGAMWRRLGTLMVQREHGSAQRLTDHADVLHACTLPLLRSARLGGKLGATSPRLADSLSNAAYGLEQTRWRTREAQTVSTARAHADTLWGPRA